jgi:Reverse transcriptase (RNA-dependent DNA polymerase)
MIEASSFPVQLAIRLLLDSVSYSNALPEWVDALVIDYNGRFKRINQALSDYSEGVIPRKAFEIEVPKKFGTPKTWVVPSVNDQIAIQACVSSISDRIEGRCIDRTVVYSSRLNRDPKRLSFLENQVDAWAKFQCVVHARCAADLLQIDLKDAYERIQRPSFLKFLNEKTDSAPAAKILTHLLTTFSNGRDGIPLINDSVFFLGNAYFSIVDAILRQKRCQFVRFVDDYKIFGASALELESLLPELRRELSALGFEINDQKLKLGTGEEYLEAISNLKYAKIPKTEYIDASVQPDIYEPEDMMKQILESLRKPDEFLHQGFGRLQMASLRRMQVRGLFTERVGYEESPLDGFRGIFSENSEALNLIVERLEDYSQKSNETWR